MMRRVDAPFTPEQVAHINEFQLAGYMHSFTCGNCSGCDRDLVATVDGLHCRRCDYRQFWVHSFMADGSAVAGYRRMFAAAGLETPNNQAGPPHG